MSRPLRKACRNGVHCQHKLKCWFAHTEDHVQVWKAQKTRLCKYADDCWEGSACPRAHSKEELLCFNCCTRGHAGQDCTHDPHGDQDEPRYPEKDAPIRPLSPPPPMAHVRRAQLIALRQMAAKTKKLQ
jgi:hypothetical protein